MEELMFDARTEELLFAAAFRLAPISVRKCAPPHPISVCRRPFRRWQICSAAAIELDCVRWSWSTTVGAALPEQEVEPHPRAPLREIPTRGCVAVAGRAGQLGTTGEASSRAARCLILGLRVRVVSAGRSCTRREELVCSTRREDLDELSARRRS